MSSGASVTTSTLGAVQPATCRGPGDATLDSVVHILCGSDKFPKAMVIAILSAGRGNHEPIMVPAAIGSTFRNRFARVGRLRCRQLALKSPECRGREFRGPPHRTTIAYAT